MIETAIQCPSLAPRRCTGELEPTEFLVARRSSSPEGESLATTRTPTAACCNLCHRRWTAQQLYLEGIEITDLIP